MKIEYIFLSILFILLEGFFSGSETGFFSLDVILLKFRSSYNKWANKLFKFISNREKIILVSLLGTNFSVIASTQLMSKAIENFKFKYYFMSLIFPFFVLFLGEIIPKFIFSRKPFNLSKISYYPFKILQIIFFPVIFIFENLIKTIDLIFKIKKELNEKISLDIENYYIKKIVKDIFSKENSIINNIIEFESQKIYYFKKPFFFYELLYFNDEEFDKITFINLKDKIINLISNKTFDYLILINKEHSKVYGYIDIKKVFNLLFSYDEINFDNKIYLLEPPIYIAESSCLLNLFEIYNKTKSKLFFSVDQYGSVSGIINIYDIFSLYYGDIFLQKENKIYYTEKISENSYICDSNLNMKYLKELINIEIKEIGKFSTLNGFLQSLTGRILKEGEKVKYKNILFEIISVNKITPDKIKITILD